MTRADPATNGATPPAPVPGAPLLFLAAFASLLLVPPIQGHARLSFTFLGIAGGLLAWLGVLVWRSRRSSRPLRMESRRPLRPHYVQAAVQLCIYTGWGLYWPKVAEAAPLIVGQILFYYVLDALLKWSRGQTWTLGLGPLPIVFSTNLFMWFREDWFVLQFAMLTVAALGKEFVHWTRDGQRRHIFNPAAFGLAVTSLVLMATGTHHLTYGIEVAKTLALPPWIYVLIFGLGMVVQSLFAVTLMTLSAGVSLLVLNVAYTGLTGVYQFTDTNIPIAVFLGIHLLVTDPATSPRSNVGRVLYGGLYGVTIFVLYSVLLHLGQPEIYDKLLAVPLLNLGVPLFDAISRRRPLVGLERLQAGIEPRRLNHAFMAVWALVFLGMWTTGFVQAPHPGGSIAFWKQALDEGKPDAGPKLFKLIGSLAHQGNGAACNKLGEIYHEGVLTEQDEERSAFYFARACELGDLRGAANVARQYLFLGRAESPEVVELALERLEGAATAERDIVCAFLVAHAYETGKGRPRDLERAARLYRMASGLGCEDSCKAWIRLALASGRAGEVRREEVQVLMDGCQQEDARSCLYLAYLQQALGRGDGSARQADALLRRASSLGCDHAARVLGDSGRWADLPPPAPLSPAIPLPFPRAPRASSG